MENAIILAGGFGKRIKPVWDAPKGLIPLWGETILWHVLAELSEMKMYQEVVMVSNEAHKEMYEEYLKNHDFGYQIKLVSDWAMMPEEARGALNDLKMGLSMCEEGGVLVLPCDTVTKGTMKLEGMVRFGQEHLDGVTVLARDMEESEIEGKFGNLRVNESGELVEFVEKPSVAISRLAAAAVYYYPESTRAWVEEYLNEGGNPESPGMIIPWLLKNGRKVYVYEVKGEIMDVGRPQELEWVKGQK